SPEWVARETRLGRLFATQAGLVRLERMHREGLLPDEMWVGLREGYRQDQQNIIRQIKQLFSDHAELEGELLFQARREALVAERGALWDALRRNYISDPVYEKLSTDIDYRLEALELIFSAARERRAGDEEV
ncbi:MAG: hypothetical protein ACP5JJ_13250, partial [Anaerolineae bacterium]